MPLKVQFRWRDSYNRIRRQTLTCTEVTIALALTAITAFVALFDAVSEAGLQSVSISIQNDDDEFTAVAESSIGRNLSMLLQGADNVKYDLNLVAPNPVLFSGTGSLITTDANIIAYTDQFLAAGKWRLNNRTPVASTALISGQLDE